MKRGEMKAEMQQYLILKALKMRKRRREIIEMAGVAQAWHGSIEKRIITNGA